MNYLKKTIIRDQKFSRGHLEEVPRPRVIRYVRNTLIAAAPTKYDSHRTEAGQVIIKFLRASRGVTKILNCIIQTMVYLNTL
jgi:hypothetical protein